MDCACPQSKPSTLPPQTPNVPWPSLLCLQALSPAGSHLLFRDRRACLHLLDLSTNATRPLLGSCSYAQWVPGTSVAVAQSGGSLAVWYCPDDADRWALCDS
jgi:hypothetical protein